jgi:hypothetical protein
MPIRLPVRLPIRRRRRVMALPAIIGVAAAVVSCTDLVDGNGLYRPDDPHRQSPPVRVSDLGSLILSPADAGAVVGSADLAQINVAAVRTLPAGVLSNPACGAVEQVGWLPTYAPSGQLGAAGLTAQDNHQNQVAETVAAFPDAASAQAFVDTVIGQWRACAEQSITVSSNGSTARWMGFGPSRSDGVEVLLVRREGGRGYACSRAIAAGSNVTADVLVCGPDETVVDGQAAHVVTAILSRLPG